MAKAIRRQYVIKRKFQLRLLLETMIFMFLVAFFVGGTIYLGVFKTVIFQLSGEKITLINRVISFRMVMWFLPTFVAIVILSIILSHRVAGPIFVFQRAIRSMARGEPVDKIRLRKRDKLKDMAEDVNALIDYFNRTHTTESGE